MKKEHVSYPIEVTTSELHFLRHILTRVKENGGHASIDSIIREEMRSLHALLTKHELEDLILRLDKCLYRVVPTLRQMRLYEMTLDEMESKAPSTEERRRKLPADMPEV